MNFDIHYEKRMKSLYNDLAFSYSMPNYWPYHRRRSLILEKRKLAIDAKTIRGKLTSAAKNYTDSLNKLDNYLYGLTVIDLRCLVEYFDININTSIDDYNIKQIMIDKIKESMLEDFEIMLQHDIQFPNRMQYRGKVSFIIYLIEQKNDYEIKVKEYNDEKEKSNELQLLLNKKLIKRI